MYRDGEMELKLEELDMLAADLGEESSVPGLLGEVDPQNELKFCLDEEDEIYEGYGRRENAYPYRQFNQYTAELRHKKVQTVLWMLFPCIGGATLWFQNLKTEELWFRQKKPIRMPRVR